MNGAINGAINEKVEPVVWVAAAVLLEDGRIAFDRRDHGGMPVADGRGGEIRDPLEHHMVVIPAAVQSGHEEHGAAQDGGRAHRSGGKICLRSQEGHRLGRFLSQRAISQHTHAAALIETPGNGEHGVEVAERYDIRNRGRIDGRKDSADLAGVVLVHRHGNAQPALAPSQGMHDLKASHVRAQQQGASARRRLGQHHAFSLERDVEFFELLVHEIDAIVDRGRETQDLQKAVAGRRHPAECPSQIWPRVAPRAGPEEEEIRGDEIKDDAAQGAAQAQG
jgi:hypothetical protein